MALLDKDDLQARIERARRHRVNHVGTKLNEAELHAFEALCEKREQTSSELIRTLIQRELEHDKTGAIPSVELVEIEGLKLFLRNMLRPLIVKGEQLPESLWNTYTEKINETKYETAESALHKHLKSIAEKQK